MSDNIPLPIITGSGLQIAADDLSGIKYQRIKIGVGADGVAQDLQPVSKAAVVADTVSVQVTAAAGTIFGYSIREAAATAGRALAILRDGTTDAAGIIAVVALDPTDAQTIWFGPQGIQVVSAIRLQRIVGTTEGCVYYL